MLGKLFGRGATKRSVTLSPLDAREIDGSFNAVVGESYHQDNLKATLASEGREFLAILVHELGNKHDPNAVMVYSAQGQLGYLPREDAPDWAPLLDRLTAEGCQGMAVDGKIHGGTNDKPSLGCVVTLPRDQSDVIDALND